MTTAPAWWWSSGSIAPPVALAPLTIDGTTFREHGRIWKWHGCTAFRLYQHWLDGRDLGPFLRWARAQDITILRVLMMQHWPDRPFLPAQYGASYYTRLPAFLAAVHAEGLRCELVALADAQLVMPSVAAQRAHLERLYAILAGGPDFLEVANEPFKNGVVPRLVAGKVPGLLQASGEYDLDTNADALVLDYVTIHTPRDAEWPRKAKDLIEVSTLGYGRGPTHGPVVADEPMGIGSKPGRSLVAADFRDYYATAEIFGAGATIHGDFAIECRVPTAAEQLCVDAVQGAWAAVPPDAQLGAYTRGGLSSCPLVHSDATALRTFAMIKGQEATAVVVRPTPDYRAVAAPGWTIRAQMGHVVRLARI